LEDLIKMKSKKGVWGSLGRLVIAVALFAVLAVALFGRGIIPELGEKITNFLRNIPEIDPSENEVSFFINNQNQLEFFTAFNKVLRTSASCSATKGACIAPLPNFDEGFYIDNMNYNLMLEQKGNDISIRLTRWAKQDVDDNSDKTEAPVSSAILPNAELCIIKDSDAKEFYENFNMIEPRETPDASGINPTSISSMIISSGIDEKKSLERRIGFKYNQQQADFEYQLLYKKKEKSLIYIMRLDRNSKTYICFLPAHNDTLSGCGRPNSEGFMDADCFDSDDSKNTLKTNMGNGLIPAEFICGDSLVVDAQCPCGGTFINAMCHNDFSREQCGCAQQLVSGYSMNILQRMIVDFEYDENSGKCVYDPAKGCKYLPLANPAFLVDAKDVNNGKCPV
jgi:hypothetical protein